MFNQVGAAFMFLMAGAFGVLVWGSFDSEGGAVATIVWSVFGLGFVALGVWMLRQR